MGIYRFLLAIAVVYFHFGGGGWAVGRMAVFAFYLISGYVIYRVLDGTYLQQQNLLSGILSFSGNRLLRILPLYLLVTLLTFALVHMRHSIVFSLNGVPGENPYTMFPDRLLSLSFPSASELLLFSWSFKWVGNYPLLNFGPDIVPQGWSIGVEMIFYFVAPLVVVLSRYYAWTPAIAALFGTAMFVWGFASMSTFSQVDNVFYKNFFPSSLLFFTGGGLYMLTNRIPWRVPFAVTSIIVACYGFWACLWASRHEPSVNGFFFNVLSTIPIGAIVIFTRLPITLRSLDRTLGNLSYGIYLNHFLVAALMLTGCEALGKPVFGRLNQLPFGYYAMALSVLAAAGTYYFIEAPLEKVRTSVRGSAPPV
jgi:peptidoglycan/LPS O-acetylase OafA/YrhL